MQDLPCLDSNCRFEEIEMRLLCNEALFTVLMSGKGLFAAEPILLLRA